jgi:hypothetical protein
MGRRLLFFPINQSTEHRLAHLTLMLKPRKPSNLESLPTEILTHIAQIAQDEHAKAETPIHENGGTCRCHGGGSSAEGPVRVSRDLIVLAEASRRVRAVLVHAGFFGSMTLRANADDLFAAGIVATDGFLRKAK